MIFVFVAEDPFTSAALALLGSFTSTSLDLLVNLARMSCTEVPLATSSNNSRRAASYSS